VLDPESGAISFGDGVNGRKPPIPGDIAVSYQYGGGASGNVAKQVDGENDLAGFWVDVGRRSQAAGWRKPPC
jgi:hypothetical protein